MNARLRFAAVAAASIMIGTGCNSTTTDDPAEPPAEESNEGSVEPDESTDESAEEVEAAEEPAGTDASAPIEMSAALCATEGGEIVPTEDGNGNIMSVVYGGGHLFTQVNYREGEETISGVQKWTVSNDGGACTLTRDATFAGDGQLEVASGWGIAIIGDYLVAEAGDQRVFRLDGTPVEVECDFMSGYITVADDGTAYVGVNSYKTLTISDTECTSSEEATHDAGFRQWEPAIIDGDVVSRVSGGDQDPAIVRVAPDGSEVWRVTTAGEGDDARDMGFLNGTAEVGGRFISGPGRPRALMALSPAGELVGLLNLEDNGPEGWPRADVNVIEEMDDSHFFVGSSAFTSDGLRRGILLVTITPAG